MLDFQDQTTCNRYAYYPKNSLQKMELDSFLARFRRFPVNVLENATKLNSKFTLDDVIQMRNKGQSFCKQTISPTDFKYIATSSFHQMLIGK